MTRVALIALALSVGLDSLASGPAWAANADQPNANVDKRNDSGGDTGDSKVDTLNKGQLDENQPAAAPANSSQAPAPSPSNAPAVPSR